jgi:hypothetical protein
MPFDFIDGSFQLEIPLRSFRRKWRRRVAQVLIAARLAKRRTPPFQTVGRCIHLLR